jgi:5-methyltetrahydrofolate--homocysteine methyltransferase
VRKQDTPIPHRGPGPLNRRMFADLQGSEKRTSKALHMAKGYGTAVIALTADEDGMALTAEKNAIAKCLYDLATTKSGVRHVDIIFNALTLLISTG